MHSAIETLAIASHYHLSHHILRLSNWLSESQKLYIMVISRVNNIREGFV